MEVAPGRQLCVAQALERDGQGKRGMIPASAISAFINQPRYDLRKFKLWSDLELEREVKTLPVRPPIWSKLHKHQKIGFLVAVRFQRVALFYDTGTGKTLMSLALVRHFKAAKVITR